jgi:hypothetical protein
MPWFVVPPTDDDAGMYATSELQEVSSLTFFVFLFPPHCFLVGFVLEEVEGAMLETPVEAAPAITTVPAVVCASGVTDAAELLAVDV